jgi:hypothetical protein
MWELIHIIACPLSTHTVYQSVVTSWRPTRLTSGCNHAQKGSPTLPNGLVYTTYGWGQGIRAASGRGRAWSGRTVCSGTLPTLDRIVAILHISNSLTLGPCKSSDTVVPCVVSLVTAGIAGRAGLIHVLHETECLAEAWASVCCEAGSRGGLLEGCRPCRPRVTSLCACGNILTSSWSAYECAAPHESAVKSWRPRLPGGVRTKAETSCPDLQARLWRTARV